MSGNVLITGAGTGLGLETALYLAEKGFDVYATIPEASQREHVENQANHRNVNLHILHLDVTKQDSIEAAVHTMMEEGGSIFALVNNAGISLRGYFEDCNDEEIRRTIEVNLFGVMSATRAVLPHMRLAKCGRLIFISSIGGRIASMARTAYCASKFGVEGFAESLYQEISPLGLKVSIIEPAIIRTERWTVNRGIAAGALAPQSPYYTWFCRQEKMSDRLVQSSPTKPADVARAVYHILTVGSPKLRYVVGRRAGLVLALRRYIPGELFERFYFGEAMRRVTGSRLFS